MPDAEAAPGAAPGAAGGGVAATLLRGGAAALCMALAFPPVGWWPLVLAWPALVAHAALSARSRRAAAVGLWLPHAIAWLVLDAWLIDVAALGWPLLAMYMGLWPALVGLLVRPARPGGPLGGVPVAPVLAAAWAGVETLRGVVLFDGYPWYLLAHPLAEWPPAVQSAAWLGADFTGFLAALVSGAAVDAAAAWRGRRAGRVPGVRVASAIAGGLLAVGLPLLGGRAIAAVDGGAADDPAAADRDRPLRVLLVQTALPQDNKIGWPLEDQVASLVRWLEMAREAAERSRRGEGRLPAAAPDLVIFPETMVPGFGFEPSVRQRLESLGDVRADFALAIEQLAADTGATVLAGTVHVASLDVEPAPGGGMRYVAGPRTNAVTAVGPGGPIDRYDKSFLTPFGETMPYISAWPWLEQRLLAVAARGMQFDLEAGPGDRRLELPRAGGSPVRVAAPICFEITVPATVHGLVRGGELPPADLILNASNDGWFGESVGGRRRHAQIARLRAIEHRRPVVRAVNTGYSMVIDPAGRITDRLGAGDYGTMGLEGVLMADVPLPGRQPLTTAYARRGPVWSLLALGLLLVTAVAATIRRPGVPGVRDD